MKEFIELAQRIKNKELREQVVAFLKDLKLSHKDFQKYPREDLKKARTMFGSSSNVAERDILNHSLSLAELCEQTTKVLQENYGIPINLDNLIAASILHDLMHLFEYKQTESGTEHTGLPLDHTTLGVAELYHRGFPEEVIHIIAAHAGEAGLTTPRNFEALIFYHLDNMLAATEFHLYSHSKSPGILLLDDETIKKMIGEKSEDKTK
jgi:7,8-dihydroneopterin 2',3'-cyclic phosphate phosphodiesterase